MRPDCQTARSYLIIDELIKSIEGWLLLAKRDCCGYAGIAITRRIAQALAMHITDPLLRQSIEASDAGFLINSLPAKLNANGVKIDCVSGASHPSMGKFSIDLGKFLALWLLVFFYYLKTLFVDPSKAGRATLLHGVPEAEMHAGGTAHRFEEFCKFGQLKSLSTASRIIVQSTKKVSSNFGEQFTYTRTPLLEIFLINPILGSERIYFLIRHFGTLIEYFILLWSIPIASILWRDFALHAVAASLNNRDLIEKNIFTNTNWLQQFLWMTDLPNRRFSSEMIMYSLNSSGLVFKSDPVIANHPSIRHLRADIIYIWSNSYRETLKEEKIFCKAVVVPPVVWCLPQIDKIKSPMPIRRICVFDVSPFSSQALHSRGLLGHYYNASTMKSFIEDIIFATNRTEEILSCDIQIILKHKRVPTVKHDLTYFQYIENLCTSNQKIFLAPEDENLYSLISHADLVIVIPYSSPAYIANYLKVPTVFYDPTGDILFSDRNLDIPFCSGSSRLAEILTKNIVNQIDF